MVLPTITCREAANSLAVKAAVNGISACAPEDSGASVTLSACASENTIWLAFINQIKVAFCYIFGQITDILAAIITINEDIADQAAEIAAIQAELPTSHVGTPTFTVNEAVAGTGATATIQSGSTDLNGGVTISLGVGPTAAGGNMGDLIFGTQFTNVIFPALGAGPKVPGGIIVNAAVSNNGPITSMNLYAYAPSANLAQGNAVKLFWGVGFTS